jgi:chromate reductase, NAD(P)H dehydrogenase (quinone)
MEMHGGTLLRVLGLVGSLRAGSLNRGLMDAAREMAPEHGMEIEVFERLREIPPYDADLDARGDPEAVGALKAAIRAADALLIASPEYNYSVPGVLKNAIDWVSRPGHQSVLVGKPVGIMGASSGAVGTARGQLHLRDVMHSTVARVFPHPDILVAAASKKFEDGRLTDVVTREFVASYLRRFAEFVRAGTIVPGPY